MKQGRLVIAGGSGFLGQSLVRAAVGRFDEIVVLSRASHEGQSGARRVWWDARSTGEWCRELDGASAVVNLVGRSVDCRKTSTNKRAILESRVNSVRALAAACASCAVPPAVWVQSGTAHIFGDTSDEILDETSPIGTGFAPEVGSAWEASFAAADLPRTRRVVLRISFVLGREGGALRILARLARLGLGGTIGSGRQYMSWIHEHDLNRIILRAIEDNRMQGMYVATAPNPVTNWEFMRHLRKAVHRPWSPPAPAALVRLASIFMRRDPELALYGRRCVPTRLLKEGFEFEFARVERGLEDLLSR